MRPLSTIGLGLSVVFACLLLFLFAEVYYLLWWKRRIIRREMIEEGYNNTNNQDWEFLYMLCWRKKSPTLLSSLVNPTYTPQQTHQNEQCQDFQFHAQLTNKDDLNGELGANVETQLITGPPRFLFPIKEETREDLELEDGKTREGKRSLSDLLKIMETPYLTPISSPITTPITQKGSCHSNNGSFGGYNPLYEATNDAEFSKIVKSSPPPKFKFLRDAEDKLQTKTMLMEEEMKKAANLHKN